MLSLFWLTRWGMSQVHTEAHNDAVAQACIAALMHRELAAALDQIELLKRIGTFGSANEPIPGIGCRRSLDSLGARAEARAERDKVRWIGEEVARVPAKKTATAKRRKQA